MFRKPFKQITFEHCAKLAHSLSDAELNDGTGYRRLLDYARSLKIRTLNKADLKQIAVRAIQAERKRRR